MDDGLTCLTLPAEVHSLARFTEFVRQGGQAAALDESLLRRLDLVLEEVFVNIAWYAYPPGESGVAEVAYAVKAPGTLFVRVTDFGVAYNPLEREDPDLSLGIDERPIGGLGVFLVKTIAREVTYAREPDRNVLSFSFQSDGATLP